MKKKKCFKTQPQIDELIIKKLNLLIDRIQLAHHWSKLLKKFKFME